MFVVDGTLLFGRFFFLATLATFREEAAFVIDDHDV
jgi:hypothetical protein